MKVIIQIPCFNEAETLPETITALPRHLAGVDQVEYLVIDDGSEDNTVAVAQECGVGHIVRLPQHLGLGGAFAAGLEACLQRGADIIVNTDADNQYNAQDICALIEPILTGQADIVIGDRGVDKLPLFPPAKRWLQRLGSWVVARAAGLHIPDATSGFRALSREAALRTIVLSGYSYTLESLIHAGARGMAVKYVPVRTNPPRRPSRLMRGTVEYLVQSMVTIMRTYAMFRPLRVFTWAATALLLLGFGLGVRYLYFFFTGQGAGHIQSVILAAVLLIAGVQLLLIGLVADLLGFNRQILEEMLYRLRRMALEDEPETHTHPPESRGK
jgi:glycosyltransferase involved in cell wall biosynthesis